MLNQLFIEGVVAKRKQGAMEVCVEHGITVVKMRIKHFLKEIDMWENYGIIIHGNLAAEVQTMNIEVGSRILVTGKALQKCFTNELTGESTSYFIIDAHDLSMMGESIKKEDSNTTSVPPKSVVQQVAARELPFPVAE